MVAFTKALPISAKFLRSDGAQFMFAPQSTRHTLPSLAVGIMAERAGISYEIQYTKAADKFFRTHEDVRADYETAIKELLVGSHPEKIDVKRIKGKRNDYYRIKLGDYRVVYALINGKIIVITTVLAGSRGDVCKKMSGLK